MTAVIMFSVLSLGPVPFHKTVLPCLAKPSTWGGAGRCQTTHLCCKVRVDVLQGGRQLTEPPRELPRLKVHALVLLLGLGLRRRRTAQRLRLRHELDVSGLQGRSEVCIDSCEHQSFGNGK